MSTWRGEDLFGSGPHRFAVGPVGLLVREPFRSPNELAVWDRYGPLAVVVVQTGRLVAPTSSELMALWGAIWSAAEADQTGMLVDDTGLEYPSMVMQRAQMTGPPAHGTHWSVGYEVTYQEDPV
ncbi:MAG: hypothetical protein AAGI30_08765 [Planctomycetota bacterium]